MPFPGAKASSFDSGHRCPLIVCDPRQRRRGIHSRALMNWGDFCPTILEWCGVEPPPGEVGLPGRSLLPLLEDETPHPGGGTWEETFFSHCFHEITNYYPYRALRGRRYKYVRNLAHRLETPLPSDLFRSLTWTAVREEEISRRTRSNRRRSGIGRRWRWPVPTWPSRSAPGRRPRRQRRESAIAFTCRRSYCCTALAAWSSTSSAHWLRLLPDSSAAMAALR